MSEEGNLVPRTYRLPKSIVDYLDMLSGKSEFVITALNTAIAEHRLLNENSVIGRAKAIEQVEEQIASIEGDDTYRDALKGLRVLSIPDTNAIDWLGEIRKTEFGKDRDHTDKEHAEIGFYTTTDPSQRGISFSPEAYDRWTSMGREYFDRLLSDYKKRIEQLVDKREKLKAEILKN